MNHTMLSGTARAALWVFGCVAAALALAATGDNSQGSSSPTGLGALAPANLAKPRPKPPFDITGTWFVDLSTGPSSFMFGPPYPKFKPAAQASVHRPYQLIETSDSSNALGSPCRQISK